MIDLDNITTTEQIRPKRKEQVLLIQSLLDQVDHINVKLAELKDDLKQEWSEREDDGDHGADDETPQQSPESDMKPEKSLDDEEHAENLDTSNAVKDAADDAEETLKYLIRI